MNLIKEVLKEQDRSEKWLGIEAGKNYSMINAYVQNRQQPRSEVLNNLAKVLQVDVKDLIVSSKKP